MTVQWWTSPVFTVAGPAISTASRRQTTQSLQKVENIVQSSAYWQRCSSDRSSGKNIGDLGCRTYLTLTDNHQRQRFTIATLLGVENGQQFAFWVDQDHSLSSQRSNVMRRLH